MEEEKIAQPGKILIDWDFPEYYQYARSKKWYIAAAILIMFFLTYAIWVKNILFAIILVLAAFISVLQQFQKPKQLTAAVTDMGIMVGDKLYPYAEIKKFWIIYNPPMAKLMYLDFNNPLKKTLPVPLEKVDPVKLREILNRYLKEDLEKEEEELGDRMARVFKI
ncbi:MAG: hypothetical protein ACOZBH_03540 [Patescibacteria group bacterium]